MARARKSAALASPSSVLSAPPSAPSGARPRRRAHLSCHGGGCATRRSLRRGCQATSREVVVRPGFVLRASSCSFCNGSSSPRALRQGLGDRRQLLEPGADLNHALGDAVLLGPAREEATPAPFDVPSPALDLVIDEELRGLLGDPLVVAFAGSNQSQVRFQLGQALEDVVEGCVGLCRESGSCSRVRIRSRCRISSVIRVVLPVPGGPSICITSGLPKRSPDDLPLVIVDLLLKPLLDLDRGSAPWRARGGRSGPLGRA